MKKQSKMVYSMKPLLHMYSINTTVKITFTYKTHITIASKFSGQNIFSIWKVNV